MVGSDLIDLMERGHALKEAVLEGNSDRVKQLLALNIYDVNEQSRSSGKTVLHIAAIRGFSEIIDILLTIGGADPTITDRNGNTPLHWCGHVESIDLLVKYGASFQVRNKMRKTPVQMAERRGVSFEVLHHLRKLAELEDCDNVVVANTSERNYYGQTIFMDFCNSVGLKVFTLVILVLLVCSLYVAYMITGFASTEKRILIDSTSSRIEL